MSDFIREYKELITTSFSALSLLAACLALFFSARTAIRGKDKLSITARTIRHPLYNKIYKIEVTVINVGRRIAALEGVCYHYAKGYSCYDYHKDGIILKEKERMMFYVDEGRTIETEYEGIRTRRYFHT